MGFPPSEKVAYAQKRTHIVAGAFIDVTAKLAVVRPSFDDARLLQAYDKTAEARILTHIRSTLYLDAVLSAYATVGDHRTDCESLSSLRELVKDKELMAGVKAMHLTYTPPISLNEKIDDRIDKQFEQRLISDHYRQAEALFESLSTETPKLWDAFAGSEIFDRIKKCRNKVLAHRGKIKTDSGPRLNSLEDFNLTWFDCEKYLASAEPILDGFASLFCQTDFNFESTRKTFGTAAEMFWKTCHGPKHQD